MSNQQILELGEQFARDHIHACCAELLEWSNTSTLRPNGRVRELAAMMAALDPISNLAIAETLIKTAAMEYVIRSAGNVPTDNIES